MAAAAASPLTSSEKKTNGAKLSRLLIDGGTTVLRNVFDGYHPPANLAANLNACYSTLNNLLRRKILNRHQWDKLFPPGGAAPDSKTFDITLLFLLLTNICGLSPPPRGWHSKPPPSDTSLEANLARVKFFRNALFGHVTTTGVDTPIFTALWQEISAVLVALGYDQGEIDRVKAERCGEEDYLDVLRGWVESEEDIKSQLKENKTKLEEVHQIEKKTHQVVTEVHQSQQEHLETLKENKSKLEEVHQIEEKTHQVVTEVRQAQQENIETLKESKSKLEEVHQIEEKTHQVVTEVRQTQQEHLETLHQLKQSFEESKVRSENNQEDEILKKLAKVDTQNDVKYYAEKYLEGTRNSIFAKVESWLDDRSSSNRVMVISGNAGMGKSVIAAVMCKRMQEKGRLSGSHFCHHDKARHRNPKVMLQSLSCHLTSCLAEYRSALVEQLSRNLGIGINDLEVGELFEFFLEEPLSKIRYPGFTSLVIIDALDESEYRGRNELLDVIGKYFNKLPVWIRFLVTTRPEVNISDSLKDLHPLLLEPQYNENLEDIRLYFKEHLNHMLKLENQELILKVLVEKSEGVILCAPFLVDFIKKNLSILTLEQIDNTLPSGISSVYQSYFKRLETELFKELKITEEQFFSFLSALAAARQPLPLGFVSKLLFSGGLSSTVRRKVKKAIACLSSLLPIHDDCVHFIHKSVKDWLTDNSCYGQHDFSVDVNEGQLILSRLCVDEFEDVKRNGVESSERFSDTTMYALQHGVQHLLQLDEDTRSCSLAELVNKYVLDIELVYAKLCVNTSIASEDIFCVKKRLKKQEHMKVLCLERQSTLESFLFLLRKHSHELEEFPHIIFQALLNEGVHELSPEASNLLDTKYSGIPYMEYLNKGDLRGAVQTRFYCSSEVACFDVSPQSDYMVCECRDGTIQLWSLDTGKLMWKRPVIKKKHYSGLNAYRVPYSYQSLFSFDCKCARSFFRSVIFHPSKDFILPGILSQAYLLDGELNRLFPESNCSFSVCSISGDKMLTDCPDDAKCLIMWNLKNGREITRVTRDKDVLSFAWSQDGRLLAISHSSGSICLVDAMNGLRTLTETVAWKACGVIKFSPDQRFLFCCHVCHHDESLCFCLNINEKNHEHFSLDVSSDSVSYEAWKFESRSESGFLLGDPLGYFRKVCDDFSEIKLAFVLSDQSVLLEIPDENVIEMVHRDTLAKDTENAKSIIWQMAFSLNGETLYVVSTESERTHIAAWDVLSGELKAEKNSGSEVSCKCCPLAVRAGVLLITSSGSLELWDFEFSECVRSWTDVRGITKVISISDERVVCAKICGKEVFILDTTDECKVSTIKLGGEFITCNTKGQWITFDSFSQSVRLWQGQTVLWEKCPPEPCLFFALWMFSPSDQFVLIGVAYDFLEQSVYVLDAVSGDPLQMLCKSKSICGCAFISDEECVVLTNDISSFSRLQIFNVRTGDLLSVMDMERCVDHLASCPEKGLIAVGLEHSMLDFKVIQVHLPGKNKDNKKAEGQFIFYKLPEN